MKRFISKVQASKPLAAIPKAFEGFASNLALPLSTSSAAPVQIGPHPVVGLQPKYTVPPIPHPCPYDHLALLVTKDGLVIRQYIPNATDSKPVSYVRVAWGSKPVRVEEVVDGGEELDWGGSVVVYGIIGVLELFSGSYLLVITSKTVVGNVIDGSHTVYEVKGVTAIPLVEAEARTVLKTLAAKSSQLEQPIPTSTSLDTTTSHPNDPEHEDSPDPDHETRQPLLQVKFSPETKDNSMNHHSKGGVAASTLLETHISSAHSSTSDLSTPDSGEHSVTSSSSPIAKALAARLSFWSRMSKRVPLSQQETAESPLLGIPVGVPTERDSIDKIMQEGAEEPATVLSSILSATAPPPASAEERHSELEQKIVRECVREFSRGMYFAYNFDITRSLQHKQDEISKSKKQQALLRDLDVYPSPDSPSSHVDVEGTKVSPMSEPNPTLPLWRRVDKRFWWNEWLSKPFVDAGLHSYVLPVMQGYYQVAHFVVPPDPITHDEDVLVDYIIISRRSRYRAGLRYQRRGIDDDANVANFVETETIMRVDRLGVENIFAYVQLRGSIPLFWTQSGYGLKPPPLLATDRTHAQNLDVLKRHFQRTVALYGPHSVLNLAEQHGKESAITQGYKEYMQELDSKVAQYHEYDFHTETRGMKYENISKLVVAMDRMFDAHGYLWISDNTVMSQQKGVWRVNCIDCLDRTNVVQSAFARYVLNKQLGAAALLNPQSESRTEIDIIFNDVWANNGDAISRAYAGTSALKGDFTRTGKRDLSGLLNDGVNSLARMYSSTFSDWFSQAVIDFVLGYRTISVFSEFLLKLQSTDPRDLIRLSRIRAEAIATSVSRVLPEGERLLAGWTVFGPEQLNTKIGDKFEEKVLLLTAKALYIISYDYTLEKVRLYTRVPLGDIIGISKGAYILSPLEEASRDPLQNAGFVITWHNSNQITRATSYSIRNSLEIATLFQSSATPAGLVLTGLARTRQSAIDASSMLTRSLSRTKVPLFSNILTNAALASGSQVTFASFKLLPIDPARTRRGSSMSGNTPDSETQIDDLSGATNCKEAGDLIISSIKRACEDLGNVQVGFVRDEDVVSLAEAQRMTSVYAKMEYGVKRLLWLGG